jgi:hypothetical protein
MSRPTTVLISGGWARLIQARGADLAAHGWTEVAPGTWEKPIGEALTAEECRREALDPPLFAGGPDDLELVP